MSYLKPEIAIKAGETCDPSQVNANVLPIAQEISGRLVDHNIVPGTFPQSRVANNCYYQVANGGTPYYVSKSADMHITDGGTGNPTSAAGNAWFVPNTAEWSTVGDMTVSPVTGESALWIIAIVQYGLAFASNASPGGALDHTHIQFAIRVNGIIADDTVTGLQDVDRPAPRTYLPQTPTKSAGAGPYSIHTFSTQTTEAMEILVCPVRMITLVPVSEGTHTVELVVRRLPFTEHNQVQGVPTPVYCYNRKLLAVDMHLQAPATGSTFSSEPSVASEGDTVNAAAMHTNTVNAIKTSLNDLGDGAIARNGLRNQHLPSRVLYPNQVGKTTGPAAVNTAYPGFGAIGVAGGWTAITDGAAAPTQTDNGSYDFTTNPAFVILLGNVHISNIRVNNPYTDRRLYAWFTIQGVYDSGTEFGASSAEMCISNPNVLQPIIIDVTGDNMDPIEMDVPLFEIFDYRTVPPAGGLIANFRILGADSYRGGGGQADVLYRKSNIAMVCLKK